MFLPVVYVMAWWLMLHEKYREKTRRFQTQYPGLLFFLLRKRQYLLTRICSADLLHGRRAGALFERIE